MKLSASCLALACVFLLGRAVSANPISTEVGWAKQVINTHHVQLAMASMLDADGGTLQNVKRDGQLIACPWQSVGFLSVNAGSGVTSYRSWQCCDCNVPIGKHEYQFMRYSIDVDVVENMNGIPERYVDASPDARPWDIREQYEQGIDCKPICAEPVIDAGSSDSAPAPDTTDAAFPTVDAAPQGADAGSSQVVDSGQPAALDGSVSANASNGANNSTVGGGCSLAVGSGVSAIGFALLAALGVLARRKKAMPKDC